MRAQSSLGNSIPVTTRHLESLIRLSQARARLELREVSMRNISALLQTPLIFHVSHFKCRLMHDSQWQISYGWIFLWLEWLLIAFNLTENDVLGSERGRCRGCGSAAAWEPSRRFHYGHRGGGLWQEGRDVIGKTCEGVWHVYGLCGLCVLHGEEVNFTIC